MRAEGLIKKYLVNFIKIMINVDDDIMLFNLKDFHKDFYVQEWKKWYPRFI